MTTQNNETQKRTLTPEEAKRRLEVKKQNDEAAKAFLPQAEAEYAKMFGIAALDEVQRKALSEPLFARARAMLLASQKGTAGVPGVRAPKEVFKRMLQKAFGYAIKAQVSQDIWESLIVEASKDPIAPAVAKKAKEPAA